MSLISLPSVCLHCPQVLCSPVQGSVAETTLHMMAAAKSSAKLENQMIELQNHVATIVGKSTNTTLQKKKKLPILVKKIPPNLLFKKG